MQMKMKVVWGLGLKILTNQPTTDVNGRPTTVVQFQILSMGNNGIGLRKDGI